MRWRLFFYRSLRESLFNLTDCFELIGNTVYRKRPDPVLGKGANLVFPKPLSGFEGFCGIGMGSGRCRPPKILPGEYYVSNQNELITTVLGSCVSACIRDPVAGVGV